METKHIQAMGLGHFDDSRPFADRRRWMACQWEDAAFEGSAEKCLVAVDHKLGSFRARVAKPKSGELLISAAGKSRAHLVKIGAEFIPRFGLEYGQFRLERPAANLPLDVQFPGHRLGGAHFGTVRCYSQSEFSCAGFAG